MKLYHGVNTDLKDKIKEEGITAPSYWGTIEVALRHSNCGKCYVIDSDQYDVKPNLTLVEYYGESDDQEDFDLFLEWQESSQTWLDSLKIFGSVVIESTVYCDSIE